MNIYLHDGRPDIPLAPGAPDEGQGPTHCGTIRVDYDYQVEEWVKELERDHKRVVRCAQGTREKGQAMSDTITHGPCPGDAPDDATACGEPSVSADVGLDEEQPRGKSPVEMRADEIEAARPINFQVALLFARDRHAEAMDGPNDLRASRLHEAAAWLLVAQRLLEREAGRWTMSGLLVAVAPNGLMVGRERHMDDLSGGVAWTSELMEARSWTAREEALEFLDKHYPLVAGCVRDGSVQLREIWR